MNSSLHIAIVGASGAVGLEILSLLEKREVPIASLRCFGSTRSLGKTVFFRGNPIKVETLTPSCFTGCDVVFFSAGKAVSLEYAPLAQKQGAIVIDNSSAFREDVDIPLVIPEVNPEALDHHKGLISNPNCAVILLLTVLAPLHKVSPLKRLVISTYQASSGAGKAAMTELQEETFAFLQGTPYERQIMPHPYAFNLFLHNSAIRPDAYLDEEWKIIQETKKILQTPSLRIAVTCVRVPVLRAHAESVNAEFTENLSVEKAYETLGKASGVKIVDDYEKNRFAMPIEAAGQDFVFCSRIRKDLSQENTLDLWVVGDQLLKGAALNAVQILETLRKKDPNLFPIRPNSEMVTLQTEEALS